MFLSQLDSLPVALLGTAAVVSVFSGAFADAIVIMAVVAVNAIVGWLTERQSERIIRGFSGLTRPTAVVMRDGREVTVDAALVVPGDVLLLRQGTIVAADARLISANHLTVDESTLTGESLPVGKDESAIDRGAPLADRMSMVYRSTLVTGGQASATTTLARGIGRLRAHGVVIRQLAALETLGSVQVLCLDKTGTITENKMRVGHGLRGGSAAGSTGRPAQASRTSAVSACAAVWVVAASRFVVQRSVDHEQRI
jgi:Ca2+-transporting ATPase